MLLVNAQFQVARDLGNDFYNGCQHHCNPQTCVLWIWLTRTTVTDNGPQFVSREFADFIQGNGIKHIHTAPYHPSSNRAVERLVQTFKQDTKVGECCGLSLQHHLQSFLMSYRSTPHATTRQSPALIFLGCPIRTRCGLLCPKLGRKVRGVQARQKQWHDAHT